MRVTLRPMISTSSLPAFSTPAIAPLQRLPATPGRVGLANAGTPSRPGPAAPPLTAPLSRTSPRGSLLDLSV